MVKRYSALAIKKINYDYVIYEDENNIEQAISLQKCSENWYFNYNKQETLIDKFINKKRRCRCVADRYWNMYEAYFMFYSDIWIKFDFKLEKNMELDDASEVRQYYWFIENQLREGGWFSFDIG